MKYFFKLFFLLSFIGSPGPKGHVSFSITLRPSLSVNFSHFHLLFWTHWTDFNQTGKNVRQVVLYQICEIGADPKFNMGQLCILIGPYFKHVLVTNYKMDWIVTLQKWLLDGPILNLWIVCRSEIQNGHHEET